MEMNRKPARRFYCYPATNEVEGPFALVELAGLLRATHITGETPTLREGEETWLPFQERPEYHLAQEMSPEAVQRHADEKAETQESSFSPRRLAVFAGVMSPVFLYLLYRFVRMYIFYHLAHDFSGGTSDSVDTPGGS